MDARDLDYSLPEERIAQEPLPERDGARMLVLDRERGTTAHRKILDLPEQLVPALFVVNDTRVLPARLFARKPTGGRVELLLVSRIEADASGTREVWSALARGAKALRPGLSLTFEGAELRGTLRALREGGEVELELAAEAGVRAAIGQAGKVPLPPYVRRDATAADEERYQTVFASREGSVAAPTAGLHFSDRLVAALAKAGHRIAKVTLHVGPGTFAPLRTDDLAEHRMHAEHYEVPHETALAIAAARAEHRPVVAVGTTVCRTLESVAEADGTVRAGSGETALFVYPPYRFRCIDALLTNFHLPRSTLLALVMAFGGIESVKSAYAEAVREQYRFYSYGDAMLVRSSKHAR
ncbi:MAG: tRNA preQ1(34) S-adenosylmethionine ribosyltransferase-isomerase QueA [Sandaracinus sp.]